MRTTFEELITHRQRSGLCPACGKKTTRSKRFAMTVNPLNRGADGVALTRDQVWAELSSEADAWKPDFYHVRCG